MSLTLSQEAILVAALILGSITNGFSGFAFTAVSGGLILHVLTPVEAILIFSGCSCALHVLNNVHFVKKIKWLGVMYYIVPGLVGIPVGAYLLNVLPRVTVALLFGSALVIYGVWILALMFGLKKRFVENDFGGRVGEVVVGFIGGVAGGLMSLPGIPIVIWANIRGYGKERQRALTVPYNFCMLLATLASALQRGVFDTPTRQTLLLSIPCMAVGWVIGVKMYGKVGETTFRAAVCLLLILSGGLLLQKFV